jgi:hypothetical protein
VKAEALECKWLWAAVAASSVKATTGSVWAAKWESVT